MLYEDSDISSDYEFGLSDNETYSGSEFIHDISRKRKYLRVYTFPVTRSPT